MTHTIMSEHEKIVVVTQHAKVVIVNGDVVWRPRLPDAAFLRICAEVSARCGLELVRSSHGLVPEVFRIMATDDETTIVQSLLDNLRTAMFTRIDRGMTYSHSLCGGLTSHNFTVWGS